MNKRDKANSKANYAFSLLPDGSSFFDDDEKEVSVFKAPLKGKGDDGGMGRFGNSNYNFKGQTTNEVNTKPYFDQIHATDSEDEESDLEFIRPDHEWKEKLINN